MLSLITTKAPQQDNRKLWFSDQDNDLFIWLDPQNKLISFQFCYNKTFDEHSISWHQHKGFSHSRIDTGETRDSRYKMTPIMVPDGTFEFKEIAELFHDISQQVDNEYADFIFHKILGYPN